MDRMHKKSALAATSGLLLAAQERGVELSWERYERQLPLCGFTSNGLNCRKCFQGPCRINPFGDEPARGICGADRDQIVMENLFQATLDGVLDATRAEAARGIAASSDADVSASVPASTRDRLARQGLLPVRRGDLLGIGNPHFSHKAYLPETARALVRLGLIHHGVLSATPPAAQASAAAGAPTVLVSGQPPAALLDAERTGALQILTHGAGHGSPELAVLDGVDALLVAPGSACTALPELAERLGVPVILSREHTPMEDVVAQARRHAERRGSSATRAAMAPTVPFERAAALRSALEAGKISGVVVLFGEPSVKQTFFERTLALAAACLGQRMLVVVGGDLGLAIERLTAALDRRQPDLLAAFAAELRSEGLAPITAFGAAEDLPRVVALLDGIRPVAAAFPEFFRASTWAAAVALLSLGWTVQIGTRLPFWGSASLVPALAAELGTLTGGRLLAGPTLPEPRAQADALLAALKAAR